MTSIRIRNVEVKDFPNLSVFLAQGFPHVTPQQWMLHFNMWWRDNPAMTPELARGWILESNQSEVAGFLGNIPVRYQVNGRSGIAAANTSWYVKPAARGYSSIQLQLAFTRQNNVDLFLATTPNEKAEKILHKLGFSRQVLPYDETEFAYILNHGKVFSLYSDRISLLRRLPIIKKIISTSMRFFSPMLSWIKDAKTTKFKQNRYYCTLINQCDETFTRLWEKNRRTDTTTLYRDADTLNWLFFSQIVKSRRHVVKCLDSHTNDLVGYCVFDIVSITYNEARVLALRDVYIPNISQDILSSFYVFSIDLAKRLNAIAIRYWAPDNKITKFFKKTLTVTRKVNYNHYFKYRLKGKHRFNNYNYEYIPSQIDPDRGIM